MDAGLLNVVESGKYFMTKDTGDVTQFHAVSCRENTLPRDDGLSQPRGWDPGKHKIGPVLEATTSCLRDKHGVEIRILSLSGDNTHSWVRISHRSNKFVIRPEALYVYTETDWTADELTRKAVSCTVGRYGSHMIDFSVAKQSLVALSSGEGEFYGIVRAVATSKQTSQILQMVHLHYRKWLRTVRFQHEQHQHEQ